MELLSILLFMGVFGVIFVLPFIFIGKSIKGYNDQRNKKIKAIVASSPQKEVILYDVMLIEQRQGDVTKCLYMPVLKEKTTGKIYISHPHSYLGELLVTYTQFSGSEPKIKITSPKGKLLEPYTQGYLYLKGEMGTVQVINNQICINEFKCDFLGNFYKKELSNGSYTAQVYNIVSKNFMQDIEGAIIYEGVSDFDMDLKMEVIQR